MLPHYQARKPWISWRIRWRRKNAVKFWCHIVWIQGDLRKICQICVQLNKQTNKQTKWMKCQVMGNQIKEEKLEICIKSVYRYERKKGKTREITSFLSILSDFQQIQVKFYQLFATVMRWSLENFRKSYPNYRSFDEKGRKKLFCKEIAKKSQKGPKMSRKKFFFQSSKKGLKR